MRYRLFIIAKLVILFGIILPFGVFAETGDAKCSPVGYSVLTINGVFTNKKEAIFNRDSLKRQLLPSFNSEPLTVDYLHNPSHLGGIGDVAKTVYQKIFDSETVEDYDLVEMLKDASEKVKTQKLLLVAHSQGNFYANSFYDTVAGQDGGVPAESIGVYAVATPASRVAGGGRWLTSDTDKIIADLVGSMPFKKIMPPNTSIQLAEGDDNMGHNFSGVYLKYRGGEIVSDIQNSLSRLKENNIQEKDSFCLIAPKLTLAHKATGVVFAVVDPVADTGKDAIVVAAGAGYKAGSALAQGAYSLTGFIAGAVASALSGDDKNTNNEAAALESIKTENISNLPAEEADLPINNVNSNSSANYVDNSQPATLTVDKVKLAEESIQDMQNQILALQNKSKSSSSSNLPGLPSSSSADKSGDQAGLTSASEAGQPKLIAPTYYPGFGGGGTGVVSSSSAGSSSLPASSSSSSADSASESSSSILSSSSSSVSSAEEASSSSSENSNSSESSSFSSSSSIPDIDPPIISFFSILECQTSLSTDGCLVATTTLNIAWNSLSEDLDYFIINNNGAVSTTTSTSTIATAPDNAAFSFAVSAKDSVGNESVATAQTAEVSTMPVVINEVAWAGNGAAYSADEWIELYNRTSLPVDLSSFILYSNYTLKRIPAPTSI